MKNISLKIGTIVCLTVFMSCSQKEITVESTEEEKTAESETNKSEAHRYGGWFCPDNLNGFPAVDISSWESVPVVNGRLPNKEETQNGTSLILVDQEKYPDAKPLDMHMPKLARYYSEHSRKEEVIIIIQAVTIQNDSIVGFRFLNGGNGSARLSEVSLLNEEEIEAFSDSRFVSFTIDINASKKVIWDVLTKEEYRESLQAVFDKENILEEGWASSTRVNFKYPNAGEITSAFAADLYGNQYIQIDAKKEAHHYVEKFLLVEYELTKHSDLQIVCGPYLEDYEAQKAILDAWAKKVKELSEAI